METAYTIVPHENGWGVEHNGQVSGPYATKEAALEAAIGPAANSIKEGYGVRIHVPGRETAQSSALGA